MSQILPKVLNVKLLNHYKPVNTFSTALHFSLHTDRLLLLKYNSSFWEVLQIKGNNFFKQFKIIVLLLCMCGCNEAGQKK